MKAIHALTSALVLAQPVAAFAQRASSEDVYGPGEGYPDFGLFGLILLLAVAYAIFRIAKTDTGFRELVLKLGAVIVGVPLIFYAFGKEAGLFAAFAVAIYAFFNDLAIRKKGSDDK